MSISSLFIRRPIGTTLLAAGLALAGAVAFNLLPVASLPQIDFPTISVSAALPGANPETMATSVAAPLERQLGHISGITQMTSTSTLGVTRINLQFDLNRDIDGAARDVQAAINAARSQLPANLPNNPTYRKVNPADTPVMVITLTSDHLSRGEMYDAASSYLQQTLAEISGVGQVLIGGSSLPAVRVELNPNALANYNIGLPEVAQAIASANVNLPKGFVSEGKLVSSIKTNDQIFKAWQFEPLIIAWRNNSPVRIADVAEVNDSVEDIRNAGLFNGKPAVLLVIFKQPGANVIATVDAVKAKLPRIKAGLPHDIDLTVALDRTKVIRASLHEVEITLLIAIFLVILVTWVFLGNLRSMLVPGVVLPLSLLGTFVFMKLFGYSLDNLSLMALTIATGFVVDDAVVVLENISRHLEQGNSPVRAALKGAQEVGFTVISMSLSLIAVFIPVLFMGGLIGRLFFEFAMTLSIAILISMVISLTVTPMMCSRLLRHQKANQPNPCRKALAKAHQWYEKSLSWSLIRPRLILLITLLTVIANVALYIIVPKGFFPQQDIGTIAASIQTDQNSSFQFTEKKLKQFVSIAMADPAVEHVIGYVGGSNNASPGSMYITLKPLPQRKVSAEVVVNRLRIQMNKVTGAALYMQASQDLVIGGRQGGAQFQYTLSGDNLNELNKWASRLTESLRQQRQLSDVNSDQRNHGLQLFVNVSRDAASSFGLTTADIDQTLYQAFGQSQVSTMYTHINQYHVVMEVAPKYWQYPETLDRLYIKSANGNQVPLSAFANFSPASTLLSVNHSGQAPAVTISFNLPKGTTIDTAINTVNKTVKNLGLPSRIWGTFQGTAQAFLASLATEPWLILAALIVIYIVLGVLYESLIHPITILSTLPSAGVGALLALLLDRTELSLIALIGIILLIGIVKKNAIMMIDVAIDLERTHKKSAREAIYEAALLRFRPILMTTSAALFGALPLVFGMGLGAELRRPLGIAIVGGLLVSQVLTLYTTPVIYLGMENLRLYINRKIRPLRTILVRT